MLKTIHRPRPPTQPTPPAVTSWQKWSKDEEKKKNISNHSASHWRAANHRGDLLSQRQVEGFYSVAVKLLPPCGQLKYTYRTLQYVQRREASATSLPCLFRHKFNSITCWTSCFQLLTSCLPLLRPFWLLILPSATKYLHTFIVKQPPV